jgi:hypothetical protein
VASITGINVFGYMKAFYPHFAIIYQAVAIIKTYFTVPHRLYLRTRQHNTHLQPILDSIFEGGRAVFDIDVGV